MFALVPFRRNACRSNVPTTGEWFDRFFDGLEWPFNKDLEVLNPAFDISESDGSIVVKADLPGIRVEDLEIDVMENVLTLRGERKEEPEETKEHYHKVERRFGSFCRSFALPREVKTEGIEATYKDGVLRVTIPKSEVSAPKKIEVKVH